MIGVCRLIEITVCVGIGIPQLEILLDIGGPGHERFQFFVRMGLSKVRQLYQHMLEVRKRFYSVCLGVNVNEYLSQVLANI